MEVEKNTNYTFSAWLKGSFLSADSVGRATIGVIDPNNKKFLTMPEKNQDVAGGMFSTNMRQLVPTAWDGRWHLRSVTFNTEEKTTVGIALYGYGTELWVDGLALFEVGDGKKYTSGGIADFTLDESLVQRLMPDGYLVEWQGIYFSGRCPACRSAEPTN